jgi:hypothetical protein
LKALSLVTPRHFIFACVIEIIEIKSEKWPKMASAHTKNQVYSIKLHHLTTNVRGGIVAGLDQDVSVSLNRPARPV